MIEATGSRRSVVRLVRLLLCSVFALGFALPARSDATVISVTGPAANNPIGIFPDQSIAVSFTIGTSYSGVTISADLIGSFSGTAYLTDQIGPGTTAANQIASASF